MANMTFNEQMKKLMKNAWILVKVKNFTISEAMKMAWKVYFLKTKGRTGKVEFDYIKKSTGELRHAIGTFNASVIPRSSKISACGYTYNPLQIRYFDVEKNGWRSCVEDNIVAVY